MGNSERAAAYFRKQIRAERERRGWSQSQLAEMLRAKGLRAHTTTIAKIEAGDRAVPIEEAGAIADVFGTSLDQLLGRDVGPEQSLRYTLEAVLDTARQASAQIVSTENALRQVGTEIAAFVEVAEADAVADQCERAADAMAIANDAVAASVAEIWKLPQLGELAKEIAHTRLFDEAQDLLGHTLLRNQVQPGKEPRP